MPKPMIWAALALAAMALVALGSRWLTDWAEPATLPATGSPAYTAKAREAARLGETASTSLWALGEEIHLGQSASLALRTDRQGVLRIPLSLAGAKAKEGARPFRILHEIDYGKVSWDGQAVIIRGLRSDAAYEARVGLWVWSKPSAPPGEAQKAARAFKDPGSIQECAQGCVAALGTPRLLRAAGESAATEIVRRWHMNLWRSFFLPAALAVGLFIFGDALARALGLLAWRFGWRGALETRAPKVG